MNLKNKNKLLINNKVKSAISIILAAVTPVSVAGCSAQNDDFDEEIPYSYIDDANDLYGPDFFGNKTAFYEYDNLVELNNVIDEIKNINYSSNNREFINFDIYSKPQVEINEIVCNNLYNSSNPDDYHISYDWYIDGVIDSNVLYNKILENNINSGIENTVEVKRIAKMVSIKLNDVVSYIRNKFPEFKFNIPFCNINSLTVNTSDEDWYYSLYVYNFDRILVNFNLGFDEDFFMRTVIHEIIHLMFNGIVDFSDFYKNGSSIDAVSTLETPLKHDFIIEYLADFYSHDIFGEPTQEKYAMEYDCINQLCLSTNKDINYFEDCVAHFDQNGLLESFEEELRDVNFVYSTISALDKSCGYGYFPDDCNIDLFKTDCYNYAVVNLLKNVYIRNIKEYSIGQITYEEAIQNIEDFKQSLGNYYVLKNNVFIIMEQLSSIFDSYVQNYSRTR